MDTFARFCSRGSAFKFDTIFNTAPITEAQKYHMTKVYNTLAYTGLVTFLTVAINGPWRHINPLVASLLLILSLVYIAFTKYNKDELNLKRMAALTVFPMTIGIIHKNFIAQVVALKPGKEVKRKRCAELVNTALMATVGIFTSFSLAALYMSSRLTMYVTSTLASIAVYVALASFANMFVASEMAHGVILSLGVVIFIGYIVIDTQRILEDFSDGDEDYMMHAILLYYDLFELFFRILIMLKNKEDRKEREQKNKHKDK
ncbi:uncharacterized protein TOT_020000944 [Theileria orientalis strain Shintoku]|uniref:Bax inhibitor-1 n=1 Tax=Theileria orientalis strain Shintoku TaxID=869250 RepID=J4D8B4_THEOR|nr:uncharacterized protein TOT_020000944 [Theileria orientalis strain Shintoku]BAM40690.1 uncharacterized protein TOT_020000944 [Theileria orientalis strain Shintoku]|eukprot:XP_009690991.1 uncharacterized protein TOT_020000944 [Theileria orientalis strain Shintoku]